MSTATAFSTLQWGRVDLSCCPNIHTSLPGPKSNEYHARCTKYFKGLSGQVKLFPVAFESGNGCVQRDVDGNEYIDFSSGIYVTTLGHCHPKISEPVAKAARTLMNAHDFTTPIKTELLEYHGGQQVWQSIQTGYDTAYPTITGGIFEFGFTDAIQQMWAAYVHELTAGSTPHRFAGCVLPEEVAVSHRLFDAALRSHQEAAVVSV